MSIDLPTLLTARHGVDLSTLSVEMDQPLDPDHLNDVYILGQRLSEFVSKNNISHINVYASPRLRAIQTAKLATSIVNQNCGTSSSYKTAHELVDIYFGKFNIENHIVGEPYLPLTFAWRAFKEQCLEDWSVPYYFGTPTKNYPMLKNHFFETGESQRSLYKRLISFYIDLAIKQSEMPYDHLNIVIGHKGTILMLDWLANLDFRIGDQLFNLPPEAIPRHFEDTTDEFKMGYAEMKPIYFPLLSERLLGKLADVEYYLSD